MNSAVCLGCVCSSSSCSNSAWNEDEAGPCVVAGDPSNGVGAERKSSFFVSRGEC